MRYALALSLLLAATPALAQQQPVCAPLPSFLEVLANEYDESPVAVFDSTNVFTITVNPQTRTWTLLRVNPHTGIACMVLSGENYEPVAYVSHRSPPPSF